MSSSVEQVAHNMPDRVPSHPHLLVVTNPGSRNYHAAIDITKQYIQEEFMHPTDCLETSRDPNVTKRALHAKLNSRNNNYDAIAVLTGDGGANPIAHYLHETNTFLPMYLGGFGTINDGHHLTVGKQEKGVIANQPIVPIFPILTTVHQPTGEVINGLAILYASLGFTADVACKANSQAHRESPMQKIPGGRKLREIAVTLGALAQARPFTIEYEQQGHTVTKKVHEWLAVNSKRMGGLPIYPGDPTIPGIKQLEVRTRLGIAACVGELACFGRAAWHDAQHTEITITTTSHDEMPFLQEDGETKALQSGTRLVMRASRKPLYIIAPGLDTSHAYT